VYVDQQLVKNLVTWVTPHFGQVRTLRRTASHEE
jgi:hypothetical protein